MPDDVRIPWWLRVLPELVPHDTPSIRDQVKCPPGTHRDLATNACVADPTPAGRGTTVDDARGPLPVDPRIMRPPKGPPGSAPEPVVRPPAPTPQPAPTGPSVVDRTTGRYFPRTTTRLPSLFEAASRAGLVLWVLGSVIFTSTEELMRQAGNRPAPTGPPRRRGRPAGTIAGDEFPWGRDPYGPYNPMPRFPATGLPIPLPRRTPRATPTTLPVDIPTTVPVPTRPRTVPRAEPSVRTVPAPGGWTLGDPLPGLGYDPYTVAPPTPAPRKSPRSTPRTRRRVRLPVWFPVGDPVSVPRAEPRPVRDPLTPQQPRARGRPRVAPQPYNPLTPTQSPMQPSPLTQFKAAPGQANPCTEQREARRQRQKDCKRYTTKTIRVCADK